MMQDGSPAPLGAHWDGEGVNFALFSSRGERVELCLFDTGLRETAHHWLPGRTGDVWHGYLPGSAVGQHYGYRLHGRYDPLQGLRFNPAKLLIDPYARALAGGFRWTPQVYDFAADDPGWQIDDRDSAPFVPKCRVVAPAPPLSGRRAGLPWPETVVYEANVRGYTMRHPELSETERGRFRGLANGRILEHLKALGITAVELMPVHALLDEAFLAARGQRNLWGYNSINFFTPDARFAVGDAAAEFIEMVDAIHDAGLEVVLDVVYNHTAEGDERGPTLSFRGLDNLAYYRAELADPGRLVNDTGCGNTINADHLQVQNLVCESLCFWHREMGVDGFRFDLATVLGRSDHGFDPAHPLLARISGEPRLAGAKFIAEPWDPGPGGYQLGQFPEPWAELNDRYRDTVRRFWRGDAGALAELAARLHGSSELFESRDRPPSASLNYVTNHDGYTLADLVSYEARHNHTNGQDNQDGHAHNFSRNYGVEGPTRDPSVLRLRRRQRLNMLATLLFSQGTPMILGGDEFGNSQAGNNNAYAQDNATGWVDWSGLRDDPEFTAQVALLVRLRREWPQLRRADYVHEAHCIDWLRPDGARKQSQDWQHLRAMMLLLGDAKPAASDGVPPARLAILINGEEQETGFRLPPPAAGWLCLFHSDPEGCRALEERQVMPALSMACLALS